MLFDEADFVDSPSGLQSTLTVLVRQRLKGAVRQKVTD